jgi:anti-anti-sigma factor
LLSRYLHRCLDRAQTVLVLDLTAVEFLDSTGLWILYQVLERAPSINMVVRLVGDVPPVRRALDGAGMTGPAFRVYRTLGAALGLAGVAPMPRTAPRDDPTPV